jgi:alpha-beta hydrolase superfamily lysophospholipase
MLATHSSQRLDHILDRGGISLHMRFLLPAAGSPSPCVIILHGLGSADDSMPAAFLCHRLLDEDVGAVLFDLNGQGGSASDKRGEEVYGEDLEAISHWAAGHDDVDEDRIGIAALGPGAEIALRAVRHGLARPRVLALISPVLEPCGLVGIRAPTLVIAGSNDPDLETLKTLVARSECATLTVLAGADSSFEESGALEECAGRVVDWLDAGFVGAAGWPEWQDEGGGD